MEFDVCLNFGPACTLQCAIEVLMQMDFDMVLDISTVELGGGPVKSEAASILFAPTGGQEGFVVALKKPNGEFELHYSKLRSVILIKINVINTI